MSDIVTVEANALVASSVTGVAYTGPTFPIQLALVTANGTATAAGTEVTGGSYARQTIATNATTSVFGAAANGAITNTTAISFAGMPAATIVGVEIWDSHVSPVRRWFGPITPKTTNAGDTVTFSAGQIVVSLV